eukprot:15473094-Alexandrium_andersonii.AAC.1
MALVVAGHPVISGLARWRNRNMQLYVPTLPPWEYPAPCLEETKMGLDDELRNVGVSENCCASSRRPPSPGHGKRHKPRPPDSVD